MKLYFLSQNDNNGYDTYVSAVVCAENETDAKSISPDGEPFIENNPFSAWAIKASAISCKEIGIANEEQKRGVVIASFKTW